MRNFLKQTFASALGTVIGLGMFATLGVVGLFVLILSAASSGETEPQIKDKSMLVFDFALTIADSRPNASTSEALGTILSGDSEAGIITLREVVNSIDAAAKDKRIAGIYLHGSSTPALSGYASLQEVRQALERFRQSGKPIIAYDMDWDEREYYLSSVADEILLNPQGLMELNGLSAETTFYTGALQKYGVGVQVTRVGKYKSAVEPFLRQNNSPENRQQTTQLLRDVWGEFVATTSKAREIPPNQLEAIASSQGLLMAPEARDRKLVDRLAYFDEVIADLKKRTGVTEADQSFNQVHLPTYASLEVANSRKGRGEIAVVYAEGTIVSGQGSPGQIGGDRIARQLRQLRQDKDVKAIVLRINSPGGGVSATEVMRREVALTQKTKPIIVSMGNIAASGGYLMAINASQIFAEPTTITGSIGVFGLLLNVQKLANQNGITWDTVQTGPLANLNTISRPLNAQELSLRQKIVDSTYSHFLKAVADARKLPQPKVADIAQGRVWSGQSAQKLGLVDELGGLDDAIAAAAIAAKLGEDWRVEEYPKARTLEEKILQRLLGAQATEPTPPDVLTQQWDRLQEDLSLLQDLNDPKGLYSRLPQLLRLE